MQDQYTLKIQYFSHNISFMIHDFPAAPNRSARCWGHYYHIHTESKDNICDISHCVSDLGGQISIDLPNHRLFRLCGGGVSAP
ncbi:hypothetical protein B9Z19DRAFT_1078394 [Tuber borchii]|uniref:Uncharacterized protein n=1 Tax=Tuber borchii TaxID=42251 RepID=A0A2T6ZZK0_TUBBO|nr:hypothetical protein B9Z19DRAFT_1078394 [Tuber borchii]